MKTHISYLSLFTTVLLLNACVTEKFENSTPENDSCMGVYFVEEQENAKTHTLEKGKDETSLSFIVRRADASKAESVEFTLDAWYIEKQRLTDTSTIEVPKAASNLFKAGKMIFYEGQKESSVTVDFPEIKPGLTYHCTLSITDLEYVSEYTDNASTLTFAVQMYEWRDIGTARYRDALFSDMFDWDGRYLETVVAIQERKDKKGFYRMKAVYSAAYLGRLIEGQEAYDEKPATIEETYESYVDKDAYIVLDATDSSKVYFPAQKTGFSDPSLGDIYIASDVPETFTSSNVLYGKLSKDGIITFPEKGILFGMNGYYYFSNSSGKFRIILPDETGKPTAAADYGVDIESEEVMPDGNIPVTFTLEKDVAYVKYCLFKGRISDTMIESRIESVKNAAEDMSGKVTESGTVNIKPLEDNAQTGMFTLVACTFDTAGNYKAYNTALLGYVSPDDERKVDIRLEAFTNDRYTSDKEKENYSSENSFQYWIRGKDITYAAINYYPTSYYLTYKEQIHKEMREYGSVNSATLKALNQSELAGIIGNNLNAGTSYTLVVYAENGYHREFFTDTVQVRGKTDYAKKSFYSHDIDMYTSPVTADSFTKDKWIPVSIDVFDAKAEGRSVRGNWRADRVSFSIDGDKMTASGLFPALNTNPDITFQYKDGRIYMTRNTLAKVVVKDSTNIIPSMRLEYKYLPKICTLSSNGYVYQSYTDKDKNELYDMMVAGFIHDDVIAFTDNRTDNVFWALVIGGYMKDSTGDEYLSTIIGDGHGDLILVRDTESGRELIKHIMTDSSDAPVTGQTLSSLNEVNRIPMPEVNSMTKNLKLIDIEDRITEFSVTTKTN